MNKFLLFLLIPAFSFAQNAFKMDKKDPKADPTVLNINDYVKGTLWTPETQGQVPLVILFTGSGPNDRNGNSMMTRNDSHKQLAKALLENNIATYRYDKRTYTLLTERKPMEDISFDDFVTDAKTVINHFKDDKRYNKIFLAGHSQGSLVALLAMDPAVDGFISLAGSANPIDEIIVQQLASQSPGLDKLAQEVFTKMRTQDSIVSNVNFYIASIVGPDIQPFMKSWMKYDPKAIISEITVPTLIVNGTRDRQIDTDQAEKLHAALPSSQLVIIKGMDHLFKQVGDDDIEAAKSYQDPSFPLHPKLVSTLVDFIQQ